jgi:hypothetical protein
MKVKNATIAIVEINSLQTITEFRFKVQDWYFILIKQSLLSVIKYEAV